MVPQCCPPKETLENSSDLSTFLGKGIFFLSNKENVTSFIHSFTER